MRIEITLVLIGFTFIKCETARNMYLVILQMRRLRARKLDHWSPNEISINFALQLLISTT